MCARASAYTACLRPHDDGWTGHLYVKPHTYTQTHKWSNNRLVTMQFFVWNLKKNGKKERKETVQINVRRILMMEIWCQNCKSTECRPDDIRRRSTTHYRDRDVLRHVTDPYSTTNSHQIPMFTMLKQLKWRLFVCNSDRLLFDSDPNEKHCRQVSSDSVWIDFFLFCWDSLWELNGQ